MADHKRFGLMLDGLAGLTTVPNQKLTFKILLSLWDTLTSPAKFQLGLNRNEEAP